MSNLRVTALGLALAIVMIIPVFAVAAPAAPELNESRHLTTASGATATVIRDSFGVPHIFSDDVRAMFYANGYVQAEDRLFQMDVLRHVARGESARFLGPGLLDMDLEARRELYTEAEREEAVRNLSPEAALIFGAFAEGVNAYIDGTRTNPLGLSAEFHAIGHVPEPWIVADTIAIAQYLLDIFGAGSGGNELTNAKILHQLRGTLGRAAEAAFNDLVWMYDRDAYSSVKPVDGRYRPIDHPKAFADIPRDQWEVIHAATLAEPAGTGESLGDVAARTLGFKFGSNALIISPEHSASGGALLLGGPQMAYYAPMVPYELGLHGAGFDAEGMGVGGTPGVIIGTGKDMSWTVTSGSSDQVDAVADRLVPGHPEQYYYGGRVMDMDCRDEVHFGLPTAIDPNPPVAALQRVCRTIHGPVFATYVPEDERDGGGFAFSRQRTHRLLEVDSGVLWLTLGKATNLQEFQDQLQDFYFSFNFHVADKDGNIAYFHTGRQPIRDDRLDPRFPRPGSPDYEWKAFRSGRALPNVINPEGGYLANWNNLPMQGWSGGDKRENWGSVHRVQLLDEVATRYIREGNVTVDDLYAINREISTREPFAPHTVPHLLRAIAASGDRSLAPVADALAAWAADDYTYGADEINGDGVRVYSHPAHAIYDAWRAALQDRVFEDELGPHARGLIYNPQESSDPHAADHGRHDNAELPLIHALQGKTSRNWFDNTLTRHEETAADVMLDVLRDVLPDVAREFGTKNVAEWKMPIHWIKFAALSGQPEITIPMVNRPSFNHLYDWGTGHAENVMPPGTHSTFLPLDYLRMQVEPGFRPANNVDQLQMYVDFEYKTVKFTHEAAMADAARVVTFEV